MHNWNKSLIVLMQPTLIEHTELHCLVLADDSKEWRAMKFPAIDGDYLWSTTADPNGERVGFLKGSLQADGTQITLERLLTSINKKLEFKILAQRTSTLKKSEIFDSLPDLAKLKQPFIGEGVFHNEDLYVPFTARAEHWEGDTENLNLEGQKIYQIKAVGEDEGDSVSLIVPYFAHRTSLVATSGGLYALGLRARHPPELWYAHRLWSEEIWSQQKRVASTIVNTTRMKFCAEANDDTLHVCWLDKRAEKRSMLRAVTLQPADEGNYQVFYRNKRDADEAWSVEALLSKDLMYAYAPAMSVEDGKIVVVWAGVKTPPLSAHGELAPNDIYFTTSGDNGRTWKPPVRVTDNMKEKKTAGRPQVVLHKGVIHLWYIQGKLEENKITPNMKLLNQPPWDIMYQHRNFPE